MWVAFGFSYYGIILFVTRVFDHTNDEDDDDGNASCDFDYQEIFFSAFSELIGVLVASFIIDRWGRVPTQTGLYFLAGVGSVLMGLMAAQGMSDVVVSLCGVVARCSIMGASCATWVSTPELFPTHLRATGHSIASSVARLGAFAAPFIVDDHSISPFTVGLVLAVVNMVAAGAAFLLPETMGKALDTVVQEKQAEQQVGDEVKNALILESEDGVSRDEAADKHISMRREASK